MNSKIAVIALALIACLVMPAVSAHSFYESKYREINILDEVPHANQYGQVIFIIRAGGGAEDLKVFVRNEADKSTQKFDTRFNPDGSRVYGQNEGWLEVDVLKDGRSEPVLLAAGNFTAALRDSNGRQPEIQHFEVKSFQAFPDAIVFQGQL